MNIIFKYETSKSLKKVDCPVCSLPIRKFAVDFSAWPVTILKPLEILEEEQLIDRIPVRDQAGPPPASS